ncbi:DNA circularization N-terminal domain-containing protein, partial [Parasutterella excrementihominis]
MNAPQLRRASFRGVPFEVTSSNLSIGRRTQ